MLLGTVRSPQAKKVKGIALLNRATVNQPGQQPARRQLMATKPKNGPEQTGSQGAAQKGHPKRRKGASRNADHEERNSPNSRKQKYLKNRPGLHPYTMTAGNDRVQ